MKRVLDMVCVGLLVACLGTACSRGADEQASPEPAVSQTAQPEQASVELSYSIFFPPQHAQCQAGEAWAREIEKRTNGAVKINVFPGASPE